MSIIEEFQELCRRDDQLKKEHFQFHVQRIAQSREGVPRERWRDDGVPDYIHLPELIEFMTGPKYDRYWKAVLKKPRQKSLVYLLTFTSNEKLPKESFKHAVVKQLEREIFSKVKYVFEHEDTNIHCHAYVTATHTINKDNFKSHIRKFGNMDIKHVKTDNGIEEYISKENTPITLK